MNPTKFRRLKKDNEIRFEEMSFVASFIFLIFLFSGLFSSIESSSLSDVIFYLLFAIPLGIITGSIFFSNYKNIIKIKNESEEDTLKRWKDKKERNIENERIERIAKEKAREKSEIEPKVKSSITEDVEGCVGCLLFPIQLAVALIFFFVIGVVIIAIIKGAFMIVF